MSYILSNGKIIKSIFSEVVYKKGNGDNRWYFADELWDEHGPFPAKEICEREFKEYCRRL